tara:strand:+ start:412 stop:588 length:177 start_codon:yes stop_codon:yes gene_type:complete
MNIPHKGGNHSSLEMASLDHYKKVAEGYRSSDEYHRMKSLYPILKSTIMDCAEEKLVN